MGPAVLPPTVPDAHGPIPHGGVDGAGGGAGGGAGEPAPGADPTPHRSHRRRALWRRILGWSLLAVLLKMLATLAVLGVLVATGLVTIMAPGAPPRPLAVQAPGVLSWSAPPMPSLTCLDSALDAQDVRRFVRRASLGHVPYVRTDAATTVWEVVLRGRLARRLSGRAALLPLVGRYGVILVPDSADGFPSERTVLHELVHHWQFGLPAHRRRTLLDSLIAADRARKMSGRRALSAFHSVALMAAFGDTGVVGELHAATRQADSLAARGGPPVAREVAAMVEVLRRPRWRWARRAFGAAALLTPLGVDPDRGLPAWEAFVEQQFYWEAMASQVDRSCPTRRSRRSMVPR